eukprot:gene3408-2359_t
MQPNRHHFDKINHIYVHKFPSRNNHIATHVKAKPPKSRKQLPTQHKFAATQTRNNSTPTPRNHKLCAINYKHINNVQETTSNTCPTLNPNHVPPPIKTPTIIIFSPKGNFPCEIHNKQALRALHTKLIPQSNKT